MVLVEEIVGRGPQDCCYFVELVTHLIDDRGWRGDAIAYTGLEIPYPDDWVEVVVGGQGKAQDEIARCIGHIHSATVVEGVPRELGHAEGRSRSGCGWVSSEDQVVGCCSRRGGDGGVYGEACEGEEGDPVVSEDVHEAPTR